MIHKLLLMTLILLTSCFKDKSSESVKALKFEQEHQEYLDSVKSKSSEILKESFDFQGIEVVYVQAGETYYQWLGHVLIRFVGSGKIPEEDYGVSFIANFNDYNLDNLKAYYGGYTVLPIIDNWGNYLKDYVVKEKRYMDRYIFPVNESVKNKIKETLKDWIVNPENAGTYSFRRNSCTALLLKLLAAGDKEVDGAKIAFPVEVVPYLQSIGKINHSYKRITVDNYLDLANQIVPREKYEY
tara:strand:+ start:1168 stop:1890 length:723 start_codon:yes stop_codon:yes gene_type:complete